MRHEGGSFPHWRAAPRITHIASQGETLGIYSINRAEWLIAEHGSYFQKLTVVSLYDTLGAESVTYILTQAEISTVVCSKDKIVKLLEVVGECKQLRTIIQMEREGDPELKEKCKAKGVTLVSFAEVEDKGAWSPQPYVGPELSDLCTIMYTSGTTGLPKGVLLTHGNLISEGMPPEQLSHAPLTRVTVASLKLTGIVLGPEDLTISYLPLAHVCLVRLRVPALPFLDRSLSVQSLRLCSPRAPAWASIRAT